MPKYTAASPDEPARAQAGADQWRTCVLCALGLMLLVAASGLSWFADAECAHLREVDGDADCTWHAEPLGHVTLEELMGTDAIVGHKHYAHLNSREYRSCFWDEKGSKERARQRVAELDRRFREKYPGVPGDIPPPECGW